MSVRPSIRCATPGDLLRRHVGRGAGNDAKFAAARPRLIEAQPEVDEDGTSIRGENDVRRLDVAVDDEPGVSVGQGVGHGRDDHRRLRPRRARFLKSAPEAVAVEKIRDDKNLPAVQADVMNRNDPGVTQLGEPARLLKEPLPLVRRHIGAASEHLDSDGPIELRVMAQIDNAITADAQSAPHLVAAESGAGGRGDPVRDRPGRRLQLELAGQMRLARRVCSGELPACKRRI